MAGSVNGGEAGSLVAATGAAVLGALTSWLSDPAVLTALAGLITAIAALRRVRQSASTIAPAPAAEVLAQVHAKVHSVEASLRDDLLLQVQRLRGTVERTQEELDQSRRQAQHLERAIGRCAQLRCPTRALL